MFAQVACRCGLLLCHVCAVPPRFKATTFVGHCREEQAAERTQEFDSDEEEPMAR